MKDGKSDSASAVLVIVTGLSLLGLLFKNNLLLWTGVGIGVLSLASKKIESFIIYIWFKLASVLGWINSRILLTVVFYVFLVPLSFLKKIFSSEDALKLKKPQNSLWISRDHHYVKEDLEDPF